MRGKTRARLQLAIVLGLVAATVPTQVMAAGDGVTLNEIRVDQTGTDNDEYFELSGPAGQSLDGYTYLVIGDGTGGSGVIEVVVSLDGQTIAADGFFLVSETTFTLGTADLLVGANGLNFENTDNLTHLLVQGFTGANGADLDTNDDGALEATPWTSIVDSVALVGTAASDPVYSSTVVGPDGTFVPGHVYDCADGWLIGPFDPTAGDDTPGADNSVCPATPDDFFIHDVQGPGASTPLPGAFVRLEGVVVGDFQGNSFAGAQLGGFFIQEEPADHDADPNTSEGIFVSAPSAPEVAVGDVVAVTGVAAEASGKTQLGNVTAVVIVGADPGAVLATPVSLPVTAQSEWEKHEGMLVTFAQDLYISEFFNFDRFNEIVLSTARQYQGTHSAEPGPAANAVTAANSLARITLDDGRNSQNPDPAIHPDGEEFTLTNTFRGGDILQEVTGVIDFAFGLYRIQPTEGATHVVANPRPTTPDPISGNIRVASSNVLNFFTHLDLGPDICGPTQNLECRGADTAEELQRQLDKLVAGIIALDADIVGVQEIENDIHPAEIDGNRAHDPVLTLVEALNEVEGSGTWAWVGPATHYNDYPVRNDIIYKTASVQLAGSPVALADEAFDRFVPDASEPVGRPPLAQTFRQIKDKGSSQPFTVVINHFKSKSSSCAAIGDPNLGDGQGDCNLTRVAQSEALLDFIDVLDDTSSGVLVMGDLNSYAREDPISTLTAGGLTELVQRYLGAEAYSYVFDGQLGYLDTAFATRSMLNRVRGLTIFHINADEPDILDYDMTFKLPPQDALYEPLPYRVSDHDPVIVGLSFGGPNS
jgi:predicted extracellular nuclease